MMSGEEAEAVLLDWRMPGLDGLAVLRRMRECRIQTPVIFLTVLSDEIYEEAALKWGAVDFIDKSRRLPIILQRLKLITEGVKTSADGGGQPPAVIRNEIGRAHVRTTVTKTNTVFRLLLEQH